MNMLDWARKEVEIACKKENPDRQDGEFDYGCGCYESALKAFESICTDGHSGTSMMFTKHILNNLINGKALTPIEDIEDVWVDVSGIMNAGVDEKHTYQCSRMFSLFKNVQEDGSVIFNDVDRVDTINMDNSSVYSCGYASDLINEMFPITMPYLPATSPFKVFVHTMLVDPENGDYDTLHIQHVIKPDGDKVMINRYYKEENHKLIEINEWEYQEREGVRVDDSII